MVGGEEMGRMNAGNRFFTKMLGLLGLGAVLFGASWVLESKSAVASHRGGFEKNANTDGAATLPAPGTYQIDPVHSFVYFGAWHHIVGLVRGRFDTTTGTITVSPDPAACTLDVTIDTFSLSTQFTERDDDLRGPDFFDVRKFPTMTYQGRSIRQASDGQWTMDGTLTIRGIGKVVPINFTFKGLFPDTHANKPARASFHATAATKRGDFGMVRDNKMELGVPPAPGNDVDIEIDVEANKVQPK
jgi:polyisoprenoid-binding protein YceI